MPPEFSGTCKASGKLGMIQVLMDAFYLEFTLNTEQKDTLTVMPTSRVQ